MPRKERQNDPIANHTRRTRAARRVGIGQECACGESRPEALIPGSDPMICARCQRIANGQSTNDRHHVAGKANNSTTIPIDVNDHRAELSASQQDWETPMLQNPDGCPIIAAASCIRGAADTIIHLMEKLIRWIPQMLVALSAYLKEKLGDKWWVGTALEPFAQKGVNRACT